MLNCPACEHGIPKGLMRRVTFDCPNCGVALRTLPNAITVWGDRLNRFAWWALIILFLTDKSWLGRNFWLLWLICFTVALGIDVLGVLFPPAGFEVLGSAVPAQYRNILPLSNREYDRRWETVRSLGIT
jgi:hypothetical protein